MGLAEVAKFVMNARGPFLPAADGHNTSRFDAHLRQAVA